MNEALLTYFSGEKNAGLLLLAIGLAGLVAAIIFIQPRFGLRSFGITLAVFAVIEVAIGAGLFLRTGPQVSSLAAQLKSDSPAFFSGEISRMNKVQRNFVYVKYAELAIILVASITAFTLKSRYSVSGVALAMLIHASILLAFDIVAERRGAAYLAAIEEQNRN